MRTRHLLGSMAQDVRYAVRLFYRRPATTLAAILSLTLGVGINTLAFSVVNALVLAELPLDRPGELVFVQRASHASHSYPNYREFRDRNDTFTGLIGYRISPMSVEIDGGASRAWGYLASGNYFDVLGVKPVVGRLFRPLDDGQPGASPFAVLSYDCWQSRFAGDPTVVGRTIRINRVPYTVLGVTPRGFHGTEIFYRPEIWVPIAMQAQIEVGNPWLENRHTMNTWVAGRLAPGVTAARAEANLNAIAASLAREHPVETQGLSMRLTRPGLVGDAMRAPVRAFTLGVLLLAILVLVAGCTNIASLLVAQGTDRQREMALRASIGAARGRLVRQVLTETLVLSLAGGALGAGVAALLSRALSAWRPPIDLPVQFDVEVDPRVFAFALAVSIVAGLFFGLVPARQASRLDANAVLKGATQPHVGSRWFALRDGLVAIQIALGFVVVAASFLALQGLQQALGMPLGLDPRRVAVAGFELGLAGYGPEQGAAFQRRVLEAVSHLPGVAAAAYSSSMPLSIDQSSTTIFAEGQAADMSVRGQGASFYSVSPGFFRALGTRLLAGRDVSWRDDRETPRVAVVNATFARRVFGTADALSRKFHNGRGSPPIEVVGIVEDGKYTSLTEAPRAAVFWPVTQAYNSTTTLIVRAEREPDALVGEVRRAIAALDPGLPVYGAATLEQMLGFVLFPSRAAALALSVFGVLSLTIVATGVYGLVSYAVARRQREIGIRIAIGASRAQVLRLVLGRLAMSIALGGVAGLALALLAGPVLANVVYLTSPRDPAVLGGVTLVLAIVGIVACWAPARRAIRVEPTAALRAE